MWAKGKTGQELSHLASFGYSIIHRQLPAIRCFCTQRHFLSTLGLLQAPKLSQLRVFILNRAASRLLPCLHQHHFKLLAALPSVQAPTNMQDFIMKLSFVRSCLTHRQRNRKRGSRTHDTNETVRMSWFHIFCRHRELCMGKVPIIDCHLIYHVDTIMYSYLNLDNVTIT
jgi:hypothetical protein